MTPQTPAPGKVEWKPGTRVQIVEQDSIYIILSTPTVEVMRNPYGKSGTPVVSLRNGRIRFLRRGTEWESDAEYPGPGDVVRVKGEEVLLLEQKRPTNFSRMTFKEKIWGVCAPDDPDGGLPGWIMDLTPYVDKLEEVK